MVYRRRVRTRLLPLAAAVVAVALAAVALGRQGAAGPSPAPAAADGATVLLELFTSQGCSSCPPADRLLSRLAAEPDLAGRVLPLAFHVDYWNSIGWRDPFSAAEWSARQERYARRLPGAQIYTPQLVIDGVAETVGSREAEIRRRIATALATPDPAAVELTVVPEDGAVRAEVRAERREGAARRPLVAWVALVEDGLSTPVGSGENAGRRLENDRVVRRLEKAFELAPRNAGSTGTVRFALDPAWRRDRLGVVAFLQDPRSLAIAGAAGRALAAGAATAP